MTQAYSKANAESGVMTANTGNTFVQALGNILVPEYLSHVIESDFDTIASNSTSASEFTASLSAMFEDTKNNIATAVLARSVNGEPALHMISSGGDVSLSAQKLSTAEATSEAMEEFLGASFKLPGDIGATIGEDGGVKIIIGLSKVIWAGSVNASSNSTDMGETFQNATVLSSNTTIGSAVHSFTLGRAVGSGVHNVHDLPNPVEIVFKRSEEAQSARRRDRNRRRHLSSDSADVSTSTSKVLLTRVETQCVYWNPLTAAWDDEGCVLVRENETHVTCACTHLTDFATAFEETLVSADFSALNNLDLLTVDNLLESPLVLMVLSGLYFFAAVASVLGTRADSSSKNIQGKKLKYMNSFRSYKEVSKAVPVKIRVARSIFTTSSGVLLGTSFGLLVLAATSFDSAFNWLFGDLGNYMLITYAGVQITLCIVGLRMVGVIPGGDSNLNLLLGWLFVLAGCFVQNGLGQQLAVQHEITLPGAFCAESKVEGLCIRSKRDLFDMFWNATTVESRQKIYEKRLPTLNCTGATSSEPASLALTDFCRDDLSDQFVGYLDMLTAFQLFFLALLVVSGVVAYRHWVQFRKRSNHIKPLQTGGKSPPPSLAPKKPAKRKPETSLEMAKELLHPLKLLSALLEKHRLLSIGFKEQVHFPRSDRVIVVLTYILSQMWVTGLFRYSGVLNEQWGCDPTELGEEQWGIGSNSTTWCSGNCVPEECGEEDPLPGQLCEAVPACDDFCKCSFRPVELVYLISQAIIVVMLSTAPVLFFNALFTLGHTKLVAADALFFSNKIRKLKVRIETFAEKEDAFVQERSRTPHGQNGAKEFQLLLRSFRGVAENLLVVNDSARVNGPNGDDPAVKQEQLAWLEFLISNIDGMEISISKQYRKKFFLQIVHLLSQKELMVFSHKELMDCTNLKVIDSFFFEGGGGGGERFLSK
jgi:hypothetical protein